MKARVEISDDSAETVLPLSASILGLSQPLGRRKRSADSLDFVEVHGAKRARTVLNSVQPSTSFVLGQPTPYANYFTTPPAPPSVEQSVPTKDEVRQYLLNANNALTPPDDVLDPARCQFFVQDTPLGTGFVTRTTDVSDATETIRSCLSNGNCFYSTSSVFASIIGCETPNNILVFAEDYVNGETYFLVSDDSCEVSDIPQDVMENVWWLRRIISKDEPVLTTARTGFSSTLID